MNRRNLLGAFATSPLLAKQAAAKKLFDVEAKALAGISHVVGHNPEYSMSNVPAKDIKLALTLARSTVESALYEGECHAVFSLDADLAAKRSFSLSAKIVFQRQRNVERTMKKLSKWGRSSHYYWMAALINSILGKPINN